MKHRGRIEFYYDEQSIFAQPPIELCDIGGGAITDGVEIALSNALLQFNEQIYGALTSEMYQTLAGEDNTRYDQICRDRTNVRENIGEIEFVQNRAIKLRSN